MTNQELVTGLPLNLKNSAIQPCFHCVAAKSTKVAFKTQHPTDNESRSFEIGDEIHMDQVAPISSASHYGSSAMIEFIDRTSRMGLDQELSLVC
mgnify:CR=1 FL=1